MKFSILFWNIWFYNQQESKHRANSLLKELSELTKQYRPNFIGLSEVAKNSKERSPAVINLLQKHGYEYNHYANPSPFNDNWSSGAAFCSLIKTTSVKNIVVSKDGFSEKLGYPGFNKEVISAEIKLPNSNKVVKIIVAHPLATIDTLKDHRVAMKKLNQLVHSRNYAENTILIGDMNEWRLFPGGFRRKVADLMYSRTGSLLHPTWRYNAKIFTPLRANLDYLYWSKQSDFSIKSFEVLPSNASDHRPLLATFEY